MVTNEVDIGPIQETKRIVPTSGIGSNSCVVSTPSRPSCENDMKREVLVFKIR